VPDTKRKRGGLERGDDDPCSAYGCRHRRGRGPGYRRLPNL
ncbi:MAG: hypothetical protein AVDCRST_MAG25-2595, partial [uncultured Rubrobacteraceae bacterium]